MTNRDLRYKILKANGHCVTSPLRVTQLLRPARSPRSPCGSRASGAKIRMGRHVGPLRVTQLLRPARGPWSRLGPRSAVQLRTAPCSSGVARARPAVPVGPAAGGASRSMRLGAVNQVGPSDTAHVSSELVKAHTPRRSTKCRNRQHHM
jgi:hypothetical protein